MSIIARTPAAQEVYCKAVCISNCSKSFRKNNACSAIREISDFSQEAQQLQFVSWTLWRIKKNASTVRQCGKKERKKERRHNSLHSHLYNCYSFIYRAQYLSPESLLDTTSLWMYKAYTVWLTACKAPEGRWAAGGADNKAYRATTLLLMRAGQGAFTAVFL